VSSIESEFLMSMETKEQYRGKWIAILGSEVIAEGIDLSDVYSEAIKKSEGRIPLFEQVPKNPKKQTLIL